ncbi:disulfide bond formation protein B [Rhodobacteraceae bacterium]|nr:disulfide bond formation protein B [Paracoccaceae bacterium]
MTTFRVRILTATTGSVLLLGGAFVFQSLGYAPCHLCLLQRWPHAAAIAIGVLILILRLPRISAALGAIATLTTAAIAIYHSLVERHIIAGPTSCTSSGPGAGSVDDLLAQINNAPLIQCDQISWQMLGLSMANLNAVFSLLLAVLWLTAAFSRAPR